MSSLVDHGVSLKSLDLALNDLSKLQHLPKCPNLITLSVRDFRVISNRSDPSGMVSWLRHCKSLKKLMLEEYKMGSSAIIDPLLDKEIPLSSLYITYASNPLDRSFYQALSTRVSLTDLHLENRDGPRADDAGHTDIMECLLCLRSLERLYMRNVIYPDDNDIVSLARQLIRLKSLSFDCQEITETTWDGLRIMRKSCARQHEL